jgi:transcriptional regulator with XRE-family HTH domain
MAERKVTQEQMGKMVGVHHTTITRLLRGRDGRPPKHLPLDLAARIAAATDGAVTANDFVDAVEDMAGAPAPGLEPLLQDASPSAATTLS